MIVQDLKSAAHGLVRRAGFDVVRVPAKRIPTGPGSDQSRPLPPGAAEELRLDHPRLVDLRRRYARLGAPDARRTIWSEEYISRELDLTHFRGDNAYMWQFRNVGANARLKYYLYLRDIAERDTYGLLETLVEDGLFGCWTFEFPGWPVASRDLLDSINELYFLDRHVQLLQRPGLTVLDIGAGYGRLAHRAITAAPQLGKYLCVDAVPESTFLCDYYLRFRGCADRAEVLPLDQVDERLADRRIDVAINVHGFSEMSRAAVRVWVERLAHLEVPLVFVVPNERDRLLSIEEDGSRRELDSLLTAHGYEVAVAEPVFPDPTLREFMGITDFFLLFRLREGSSTVYARG